MSENNISTGAAALRPFMYSANAKAWAIGQPQGNGFHIRRVVWGLEMATAERRDDEEIRAAVLMVEREWKPRHRMPRSL